MTWDSSDSKFYNYQRQSGYLIAGQDPCTAQPHRTPGGQFLTGAPVKNAPERSSGFSTDPWHLIGLHSIRTGVFSQRDLK